VLALSLSADWKHTSWAVAAPASDEGGAAPHSREFIYKAATSQEGIPAHYLWLPQAVFSARGVRYPRGGGEGGGTSVYLVYQTTILKHSPRRTGTLGAVPPA